jgi:acyl-coenzyme A thioesterase PaaI-like protein
VDDVNALLEDSFPSAHADGFRCEELGDGVAVARWTFDVSRLRPGAYIPGPTIFTGADIALWFAVFTVIGIEPMAVTSEMSVRFVRPAQGRDLLARAVVNSATARRIVGTIDLWVDGAPDRIVAVAQGAYALPERSIF